MDDTSFYGKMLKISFLPKFVKYTMIILTNWFFRGVVHMDRTEKTFNICLDFILFTLILIIFKPFFQISPVLCFMLSHSFLWIFNGQIFVLFKNLKLTRTKTLLFYSYLSYLQHRYCNKHNVIAVAAFGSLSRGRISEQSDLDIRIIRKNGFFNGVISCFQIFYD